MPVVLTQRLRSYCAWLLVAGAAGSLLACQPQSQEARQEKPNWMQEPFAKSAQVLLTNDARFKDGQQMQGASAFLLQGEGQRYGITAKHLTGPDGGIEPQKQKATLNEEITSWQLFAPGRQDTVALGRLVNTAAADTADDVLLFTIRSGGAAYQALTPRYEAPAIGEEVYIIGCPRAEPACTQNRYPVQVVYTTAENYYLKENKVPELAGFSGCPIVDKQGRVMGLLTGSVRLQNGETYTVVSPLKEAAQHRQ